MALDSLSRAGSSSMLALTAITVSKHNQLIITMHDNCFLLAARRPHGICGMCAHPALAMIKRTQRTIRLRVAIPWLDHEELAASRALATNYLRGAFNELAVP